MLRNILIIAAVVIVILILRSISEKRITLSDAGGDSGTEPPENPGDEYGSLDGEVEGVEYTADMYSDDSVTVEIGLDEPPSRPAEMDLRDGSGLKLDPADPMRPEAEALAAMGANYIDVGYGSDRVAAEFPATMKMDRAFAEKAVRLLIKLRDKAG